MSKLSGAEIVEKLRVMSLQNDNVIAQEEIGYAITDLLDFEDDCVVCYEFGRVEYLAHQSIDKNNTEKVIFHFVDHDVYICQIDYQNYWRETSFDPIKDSNTYEVESIPTLNASWERKTVKAVEPTALNFEKIVAIINTLILNYAIIDWSYVGTCDKRYAITIGDIEIVEQIIEKKDTVKQFHVVYYFKKHDIYIRHDGTHSDIYGVELTGLPYQVYLKNKIVSVYEK